MINGISRVDGYYDLSVWETITIVISEMTPSSDNSIRVRMKDNSVGDGDWIILNGAGTHQINITDFKKGGNSLNYEKIDGIQFSGSGSVSNGSATFSQLYFERGDLTTIVRSNLNDLITLAKKYHSLGQTESSYTALTTQISTAEGVRDNGDATVDQLSTAKTQLQNKIDALELLPGYSKLTTSMFKTWKVEEGNFVYDTDCSASLKLFTPSDGYGYVFYGVVSGDWQNYADLSAYSKMYVTGTPGQQIRGYLNKSPEGTGTVDITLTFNSEGIAEFDFVNSANFSSANYIHLIFLKATAASNEISSILLYDEKYELKNVITKANKQSSFAKTEDSYNTFTSAVETANAVLANRTANETAINNAKNGVLDAINNFTLVDGYTRLTKDMYYKWDSSTVPTSKTNASSNCYLNLNESTGQPYGDGNVNYLYFADLSEYNSMIILAPEGTPRVMLNRGVPVLNDNPANETDYKDKNGGDYVQLTDTPVDGKVTINLRSYAYAHLNAIKGYNYGNVTVTDMLLYRTIPVSSVGYATFGSLDKNVKLNGVTGYAATYANGNLTLTEVTNVPAGKGVIIKGTEGEYAPTFDVDADDIVSDLMISNGTVTGDGTIYVLNKVNDVVGFYKLNNGRTLGAGKVYLKINNPGSRSFIAINDSDITGITETGAVSADKQCYDLQGRRVAQPTKGLYIVNGKKVIK